MKNFKNWLMSHKYSANDLTINDLIIIDSNDSINLENWIKTNANLDNLNIKGEGEIVAVLDTGVDFNHIEIKNKVLPLSFIDGCNDPYDYANHGTFTIGEIVSTNLGIAPNALCVSMKVFHGDGRDNNLHQMEKGISKAIYEACERGCGVISMSFGGPNKSILIEKALKYVVNKGVIPIASSGNEGMRGSPYPSYPASFKSCISVASADKNGMPAWYSTAGKLKSIEEQPEIAISSENYHIGILPNNKYGKMTGTSVSCPIVAGIALLWRQSIQKKYRLPHGKNVLLEFRKWLYNNAKDSNFNGWDNEIGFGVFVLNERGFE